MYAIIETGGKQYKVSEGENIFIEKLDVEEGESVDFSEVLFVNKDGNITFGAPYVESAKVKATVLEHGRQKKVVVAKFKPKKTYFRKKGHRQPYTKVKIESIEA